MGVTFLTEQTRAQMFVTYLKEEPLTLPRLIKSVTFLKEEPPTLTKVNKGHHLPEGVTTSLTKGVAFLKEEPLSLTKSNQERHLH